VERFIGFFSLWRTPFSLDVKKKQRTGGRNRTGGEGAGKAKRRESHNEQWGRHHLELS